MEKEHPTEVVVIHGYSWSFTVLSSLGAYGNFMIVWQSC